MAMIAVTSEQLLGRYPLRLRWSLRTMLAGVALVAVVCAWFVNARQRAQEEDKLIARVQPSDGVVYLKGRGPAWLDLFGAGRLRRRIVGAYIRDVTRENEVEFLKRLAKSPQLRYLEVQPELIPEAEVVLGEMRQLRTLRMRCRMYDQLAILAAVGKLAELERLGVSVSLAGPGDLDPLAGLTNLKALTLDVRSEIDPHDGLAALAKLPRLEHLLLTTWQVSTVDLASIAGLKKLKSLRIQCMPGGLAPLPALPQLEALDLTQLPGGDADLGRLADCPRLKSLCLAQTGVSATGLASLASVESLRELAIDEDTLTAEGLESLAALKNLKRLHITHVMEEYTDNDVSCSIVLDDGQPLVVPSSGLDRLRQAIDSLRRAHPGIVIDTDYQGFEEREFQRLFELAPPPGSHPAL
ncbi:MAG TPA: hypothetical protein VJ783_16995 [Pirellulales bacterium]|nr:hypothetical protein [Pirellulales bacterium]